MKASEYRKKMASAGRSSETIHDVKLPSGCVWKLKEPPIQQFIVSGKLPASLAAKMAQVSTANGGDQTAVSEALKQELTPEDFTNSLAFGRDLLLFCAVEPRISLNPTFEDEIAPEEIDPEDFDFLLGWVISGGKSGSGLGLFRSKRQ